MKNRLLISALLISATAQAVSITEVQDQYRTPGTVPFKSARGEKLWQSQPNQNRQCNNCHGKDLRQPGQHQRTHKTIEPMAPSVTADRFSDFAKVEKWFKRNCQWTWGRACTPQEKGDLIEYLKQF